MEEHNVTELAPRASLPSVSEIRRIWQSHSDGTADQSGVALAQKYADLAAQALSQGESFLAQDIARAGRKALAKDTAPNRDTDPAQALQIQIRLTHSIALAHARQGLRSAAISEIEQLEAAYPEASDTPDLIGLRARIFKDWAFATPDAKERAKCFECSHDAYVRGYNLARSSKQDQEATYLGINSAATAVWLGRPARAAEVAGEVASLLPSTPASDYWSLAALGEALLIQRRLPESIAIYQRARAEIGRSRRWADLASTRQQARLLCLALKLDFGPVDEAFAFPQYCVFSGHMVDSPERSRVRLPNTVEARETLRQQIQEYIDRERIQFAVCSAACGSDLIFVDAMIRAGGEVHIVIPWPREQFIESSVAPGGDYWLGEFNRLMGLASSVTFLTQQSLPDNNGIAFEFCNHCISGIAMQRARALGTKLVPFAVWDGRPGKGPGGTASFVDFWESLGHSNFWISTPNAAAPSEHTPGIAQPVDRHSDFDIGNGRFVIKTMLFADVVGYSKIPEAQIRSFPVAFLGPIAELISSGRAGRPVLSNTWGDAVYLVFDAVNEAGQFALAMRQLISGTDWSKHGLPNLSIRIGLHTGPVLLCIDPVLNRLTFTGPHVNHAARIEPIVVPGEVYATEGFVANAEILRYRNIKLGFQYEYVGEMDFAKSYGCFPLFRLTESSPS